LSRTALPVGVRTGLVDAYGFRRSDGALSSAASTGSPEGQRPQRLVLSTSSFMDLPEGAKFQWVEIEARRWRSTGPTCSSWRRRCAGTP
jgi:hypothetical protein